MRSCRHTISAGCQRKHALLQALALVLGWAEAIVRMVKNNFWMWQLEPVTFDPLKF